MSRIAPPPANSCKSGDGDGLPLSSSGQPIWKFTQAETRVILRPEYLRPRRRSLIPTRPTTSESGDNRQNNQTPRAEPIIESNWLAAGETSPEPRDKQQLVDACDAGIADPPLYAHYRPYLEDSEENGGLQLMPDRRAAARRLR